MNDLNSVFVVGEVEKVDPDFLTIINRHVEWNQPGPGSAVPHEDRFQVETDGHARKWIEKVGPGRLVGSRIGINGRMVQKGERITIKAFSLQTLGTQEDR